jgi:hypothetical protein
MLIHPTVERLRALGLAAMADAFMELHNAPDAGELSREDWLGLLVDARRPAARTSASPAACAKRGCASPPSSRTSISAPIAASTAPCSRSSPPANGSASITTWS